MSGPRMIPIEATYDPVIHRWRIRCCECGRESVRAKREASEHVMAQHIAYDHEAEMKVDRRRR